MAGLRITLLVILMLLMDFSHSEEEKIWELGRVEFAMKYCNEAEFDDLDQPDFKKDPVTLASTAAKLVKTGVLDLSTELQKYTDDLLSADTTTLEKLYKDINCVLGGFNKVGEDIMAGGVADVCDKDVNYQDPSEVTPCIISICGHIESLVNEMDAFGDTLTPEQSSDAADVFWKITNSLATLENGLRVLKSDFSGPNEGSTRKYVEEYMVDSCPGGKELISALKDKSANPIKLRFQVVDRAGLPELLKNLKADLDEFLTQDETDGVSDKLEKLWENLLCKIVPFYAVIDHLIGGGNVLCFDPDIDYDNGQEVAQCLKKRIDTIGSALSNMTEKKGYPHFDSFLVSVQQVWHCLTDLQVGFAQLLRLANQG